MRRLFPPLLLVLTLTLPLLAISVLAEDQKILKVGVLNELSGPVASLGETCQRGIRLAMSDFAPGGIANEVVIKVFTADVHDDAKTAVSEFYKLVQTDGVQVLIAVRSKSAMPIAPLADRLKVPVVGIVGAPRFVSDYRSTLRVYVTAEQDGAFQARLAHQLGGRSAAIISAEDEWALSLSKSIGRTFRSLGGSILFNQAFAGIETDFATSISKLKSLSPQVVFVNLLTRSGLFVRKLREAGFRAQVFSSYWIQQPEQIQIAGKDALEGLIFSEVDSNKPKLREAYAREFPGQAYNPAAYLCYCALAAVLQAGTSAQGQNSGSVHDAILRIEKLNTPDGDLHFHDREIQFALGARVFKDGEVIPLLQRGMSSP